MRLPSLASIQSIGGNIGGLMAPILTGYILGATGSFVGAGHPGDQNFQETSLVRAIHLLYSSRVFSNPFSSTRARVFL